MPLVSPRRRCTRVSLSNRYSLFKDGAVVVLESLDVLFKSLKSLDRLLIWIGPDLWM